MAKRKIYRAGVIPYLEVDGEIHMMFMKPANPKYGGKTYQISKGKVEEGEKIEDAAKREAKEELGLFVGNVLEFSSLGEWLGRTTFYVAHIKDKEMFGDPHFETGSTAWLTLEEFIKEGRDLHKPVVKAAHRKMKKILKK
jgi:8-oxo-dGTP pyrophosphatase MutT (NUDIX family)